MHVSEVCYSTETCFTSLLLLPRYFCNYSLSFPFFLIFPLAALFSFYCFFFPFLSFLQLHASFKMCESHYVLFSVPTSSFLVFLPFSLAPFLPIYFSAFLPYFLSTFPLPSFLLILLSFRHTFLSLFLYLLPFFLLFHPFCLFMDASFASYLSSLSRLFLFLVVLPSSSFS